MKTTRLGGLAGAPPDTGAYGGLVQLGARRVRRVACVRACVRVTQMTDTSRR